MTGAFIETTARATAPTTAPGDGTEAMRAWRALRDSGDIQFAPVGPPPPPPEPPSWLTALRNLLRAILEPIGQAIGLSWPILEKLLIVLAVLLVLLLAARLLAPAVARWRAAAPASADEPGWTPDRGEAAALLAEADRLAGDGRFAEAVHLLLRRSIGQIAGQRPEWLRPASTAREIAGLAALSDRARAAFAVIAARVERSRFGLRALDRGDWDAARGAYADFALAELAR